jgi:hypothetical protein
MTEWNSVDFLDDQEFNAFVDTIEDGDEKETEIKLHSKRLLINEMKKYSNFYNFVERYSPKDLSVINGKKFVSQRVICQHVTHWNETHPKNKIKNLRVFFL